MPSSTVFSYWRQRRRSSASPGSPSISQQQQQQQSLSKADISPVSPLPPKISGVPVVASTSPRTFNGPTIAGRDASSEKNENGNENENGPDFDTGKRLKNNNNNDNLVYNNGVRNNDNNNNNDNRAGTTGSPASSSSPVNLSVPPSSFSKRLSRPRSSPERRDDQEPALTPASNHSQPASSATSASRQDNAETDSSKSSTPFRLTFPKAILRAQTHSDGQKRSLTHNGVSSSPGSNFRFVSSSEDGLRGNKDKDKERDKGRTRDSEKEKKTSSSHHNHQNRDGSVELTHHKSGKAVLHLLNPMSLLARRRSSRVVGSRPAGPNAGYPGSVPAIPEDYDPRIRGSIVHDFSAPRARRNMSSASALQQDSAIRFSGHGQDRCELSLASNSNKHNEKQESSGQRSSRQHTPAFKENFDDDQNTLQVESKGYLNSELLANPLHRAHEQSVPEFARNLPSSVPDGNSNAEEDPNRLVVILRSLPKAQEKDSATENQAQRSDQGQGRVENVPQRQPPSGIPKRFRSNASRFSFDMNGAESSVEEKFLEDKHKKNEEATRLAKAQLGEEDNGSDFDDSFDSDILDDMDGLEEKIPGVNVDAEEEETGEDESFSGFSGPGNATSFYAVGSSPDIRNLTNPLDQNLVVPPLLQAVPQNNAAVNSKVIEDSPADHSYSPSARSEPGGPPKQMDEQTQEAIGMDPSVELGPDQKNEDAKTGESQCHDSKNNNDDDYDDLYFDDGEFDDLVADGDGEKFDESIFDDETSHLYDRDTPAARLAAARLRGNNDDAYEEEGSRQLETVPERDQQQGDLKHAPSMASEFRKTVTSNHGQPSERMPDLGPSYAHGGVLSEHNLEAFHNALEKAASENAMADTRYEWDVSVSGLSLGQESTDETTHTTLDSHPGLVSDDSRLSQAADAVGIEDVFEDVNYDYENDDGAFYDDPIIAAANAEVLENDEEGFYGEEFGFYPQQHASPNGELTNGGYFGPRGVDGINRSRSGRSKIQEPSLTPITERSEWSTRNSIASLNAFGGVTHPTTSSPGPGLAQLVDMSHNMDDEMSLSALLKLRREAWGGGSRSDGSLSSGANSPPLFPPPSSYPLSSVNDDKKKKKNNNSNKAYVNVDTGPNQPTNRSSFPGSGTLQRTKSAVPLSVSVPLGDDHDDDGYSPGSLRTGSWTSSDVDDHDADTRGSRQLVTCESKDRRSV